MAVSDYIKLTPLRRSANFGIVAVSQSNLWLGSDHLLSVERVHYNEKYRRFYFRDIQAITLRRTKRSLVLTLIVGILLLLFLLLIVVSSAIEARVVWSILAGVCAIPLVVNLIYGPACTCELRTAVQTENIPSMSRVRRARKVLERIRPLIAAAQGQLTPEEVSRGFRGDVAPPPPSEPPFTLTPAPGPELPS
jgi:uncharacterized integral membrane protein